MKKPLIPIMLCFFTMGFVDLVGIASNYVKADLGLSDTVANVMPSLVFFWFLVLSIPTSLLMNRIGRRRTVLISLMITVAALLVPTISERYGIMLVAFSLLGIGNALLQTSLNPLVDSVVRGGNLAGTLTFGQFVKAIASFMAPYIALWGASQQMPTLGLGWRVLFLIYLVVAIAAALLLFGTPIAEDDVCPAADASHATGFAPALRLLRKPDVLLCFLAIVCLVGVDVGINTTAPKILMERLGQPLDQAAKATSLYFISRTVGCLAGSVLLAKVRESPFLLISVVFMALAVVGLLVGHSAPMLQVAIVLMGLGGSNVFSLIFSRALTAVPEQKNEVSGLLIMGLSGGALFPLLMGYASDAMGQAGAVLVMAVGIAYLIVFWALARR